MNKKVKVFNVECEIKDLPSTLEELCVEAGEAAVYEMALSQWLYHKHMTAVRAEVVASLETEFSAKKEDGESEASFVARVFEESGGADEARYSGLIKAAVSSVKPNFKKTVRTSSGKPKISKKWLESVDAYIAEGKLEILCEKLNEHKLLERSDLSADMPYAREHVAAAMRDLQKAVIAQNQIQI